MVLHKHGAAGTAHQKRWHKQPQLTTIYPHPDGLQKLVRVEVFYAKSVGVKSRNFPQPILPPAVLKNLWEVHFV